MRTRSRKQIIVVGDRALIVPDNEKDRTLNMVFIFLQM
jgi:hypothetical protein